MMPILLDEDHHVHSTFSDDAVSTLAQNVAVARQRGLRVLCLADLPAAAALQMAARPQLAHLFSILPKMGLARTVRAFAEAGVPLVASTDSHDCRDIGAYAAVRRIAGGTFPDLVE